MSVGVANHGGIGGEKFGNVKQVGGEGEGFDHRDAGVGAEQRFVGVEREVGEADGFQVWGLVIGHLRWLGGGGLWPMEKTECMRSLQLL